MEIFLFLLAPFVASLILTGIHAYLGVHVVERGVIFVDLALAQIAAERLANEKHVLCKDRLVKAVLVADIVHILCPRVERHQRRHRIAG